MGKYLIFACALALMAGLAVPAHAQAACPTTSAAAIALFTDDRDYSEAQLLALSRCPEPLAREFAFAAMANLGASPSQPVIDAVMVGLIDDAESVRREASFALITIGEPVRAALTQQVVADDVSDPQAGDGHLVSIAQLRRLMALMDSMSSQERGAFRQRLRPNGDAAAAWAVSYPQGPEAPAHMPSSWREQLRIGQFCSGLYASRVDRAEAKPVLEAMITALLRNEPYEGWQARSVAENECTRTTTGRYVFELLGRWDRPALRTLVAQNLSAPNTAQLDARPILSALGFPSGELLDFLSTSAQSGRIGGLWVDLADEAFFRINDGAPRQGHEHEAARIADVLAANWPRLAPDVRMRAVRQVLAALGADDPRRSQVIQISLMSTSMWERRFALESVCGQSLEEATRVWSVADTCQSPRADESEQAFEQRVRAYNSPMINVELSWQERHAPDERWGMVMLEDGRIVPEQNLEGLQDFQGMTDEQPSPPPSPVVEPPGPSPATLPRFPWPLPRPFQAQDITVEIGANASTTWGQINDRLTGAVRGANQNYQPSLFSVPNGFAVLARPERINQDGSPLPEAERWVTADNSTVVSRLNRFFGRPGYRRIIVFVVVRQPLFSPQAPLSDILQLGQGAAELPPDMRDDMLGDRRVFAVVYSVKFTQIGVKQPWGATPHISVHLTKSQIGPNLGLH